MPDSDVEVGEVGGYWLSILNSFALQSPIVRLNAYRCVETESHLIMQLHVVFQSVLSRTLVVLEWFNLKLTACFSRRVAKLTWIYRSVKKLCGCFRPILPVWYFRSSKL